MSKQSKHDLTEAEIIAWVIPRIAGGHYVLSDDERGRELWVNEFEATLEEMEGELCYGPDKRVQEPLRRLKEDCNPTTVRVFLDTLLGEKLGGMMADQFSRIDLTVAHYAIVVTAGYRQLQSLTGSIQTILTKEREGISVDWLANIEEKADPKGVSVAVVTHYAKEISQLFPRMVKRAEVLRIVSTKEKAPIIVRRYIEEATKCYIYGRFIACIIVCRSAIEFALRERLASSGKNYELSTLKEQKQDSLYSLIALTRKVFPKLKSTLDDADLIRRAAGDAVHKAEPSSIICKDMFIKTRGVLRELYSPEH
jgi:hypothetical protein